MKAGKCEIVDFEYVVLEIINCLEIIITNITRQGGRVSESKLSSGILGEGEMLWWMGGMYVDSFLGFLVGVLLKHVAS